jgi:hypothetical protein
VFPVLGIPILVAALEVQSPVDLGSCQIAAPIQQQMGDGATGSASGGYELFVRFANAGNQPLKRVVFALNDGSTVVDVGTFTPGVTIDHRLDLAPTNAASCHVVSATFADGTQWNASQPEQTASR